MFRLKKTSLLSMYPKNQDMGILFVGVSRKTGAEGLFRGSYSCRSLRVAEFSGLLFLSSLI